MFAFQPRKELTLESPLAPEVLIEKLREQTEAVEEFPLRSKLSGAGIVVRVLHAPETDKPLFGRIGADGFKLAQVPDPARQGPFQPLVEGNVSDSQIGSRIELTLRPHKQVRTYSPIFAAMAILLFLVAGVQFAAKPEIALIAAVFGGLFLVFPRFRAKHGFDQGCGEVESTLRRLFECE